MAVSTRKFTSLNYKQNRSKPKQDITTKAEVKLPKSSFILKNIDFKIKDGELVAIIGTVGSGKSSLVHALLGDLYKISGKISEVYGRISYVAQQAWIMNMSLKENILFDNP